MSGSKEAFGHSGPKQSWRATTPRYHCPVCGGHSWCAVRADGLLVVCRRNAYGREKYDRHGAPYWLHTGDGQPIDAKELPPEQGIERASVNDLDAAYRVLLTKLQLTEPHRKALKARGLDDAAIGRAGYRTLPAGGRTALGRAVSSHCSLDGVPGFHVGYGSWILGGAPGILIPLRDFEGRIVALKVRRDDAGDGPRYLYLSSAKHGGPTATHALHVPAVVTTPAQTLRITEGELKADVATHLSGIPTLSVPGVGAWRMAIDAAKHFRTERVQVAFDADWRTNIHVCRAAIDLGKALKAAGFVASQLTWDASEGKGIDDHLLFLRNQRAA